MLFVWDVFAVITIFPINATTGTGWSDGDYTACMEYEGHQFIQCIERHAYSEEDLLLESNKNIKFRKNFVVNYTAIVQSLEIGEGDITFQSKSTMEIKVNHNLNYFVFITDPKLEFFFDSPSIIPRIMLSLREKTRLMLHLEVGSTAIISYMITFLYAQKINKKIYGDNIEQVPKTKIGCACGHIHRLLCIKIPIALVMK